MCCVSNAGEEKKPPKISLRIFYSLAFLRFLTQASPSRASTENLFSLSVMQQFSFVLLVTAFTARLSANPLPDAQLGFDIAADTINFQEPTAPSEDQIDPTMNQVLDGLMKGGQMRTDPQKLRACSGNTNLCCFKNPAGSGGAELIQGREQQTCAKRKATHFLNNLTHQHY